MARDSIVIYKSVADALSELDTETYKKVMTAIFAYAYDGKDPEFESVVERMAWHLIRPQIDACIKRYEAQVENGKKRWKAKKSQTKPNLANDSHEEPNDNDNDNDNDDDNDDELIMTTAGTMIRKGDIHFGKTVRLGIKRTETFSSQDTLPEQLDNRQPITQEEKDRIMKRLEDFKRRQGG